MTLSKSLFWTSLVVVILRDFFTDISNYDNYAFAAAAMLVVLTAYVIFDRSKV